LYLKQTLFKVFFFLGVGPSTAGPTGVGLVFSKWLLKEVQDVARS